VIELYGYLLRILLTSLEYSPRVLFLVLQRYSDFSDAKLYRNMINKLANGLIDISPKEETNMNNRIIEEENT